MFVIQLTFYVSSKKYFLRRQSLTFIFNVTGYEPVFFALAFKIDITFWSPLNISLQLTNK